MLFSRPVRKISGPVAATVIGGLILSGLHSANWRFYNSEDSLLFLLQRAYWSPPFWVWILLAAVTAALAWSALTSRRAQRGAHMSKIDNDGDAMGVLPNKSAVMTHLVALAKSAQNQIWTMRAHLGEANDEQPFFDQIAASVLERPMTDVRRLIYLSRTLSTRRHLRWLVDTLAEKESVKVRYLTSLSPHFDLAVFDRTRAVLGLPQAGTEGFSGALYFADPDAVRGVEEVFKSLWDVATPLFSGSASHDEQEKANLRAIVDRVCDQAGCP